MVAHVDLVAGSVQLRQQIQPQGHLVASVMRPHFRATASFQVQLIYRVVRIPKRRAARKSVRSRCQRADAVRVPANIHVKHTVSLSLSLSLLPRSKPDDRFDFPTLPYRLFLMIKFVIKLICFKTPTTVKHSVAFEMPLGDSLSSFVFPLFHFSKSECKFTPSNAENKSSAKG